MEVRLNIPFDQLLKIIKQLTPLQRKKVQAVLKAEQADTGEDILAFGGMLGDMSEHDYSDFSRRLKEVRAGMFDGREGAR